MSSTVASTLQQMVMFIVDDVVDDVVEEDCHLLASELGSTIPQNRMSRSLNPASHDICHNSVPMPAEKWRADANPTARTSQHVCPIKD